MELQHLKKCITTTMLLVTHLQRVGFFLIVKVIKTNKKLEIRNTNY